MRPAMVGRFFGAGQLRVFQSKEIVFRVAFECSPSIANEISTSVLRRVAFGYEGRPAQVPVSPHHAASSKKDFPSPLSPVIRLSRSAGSRTNLCAGPSPLV